MWGAACLIFAGAAQCDTLIQQTVVTDHGGFPDHDTHAVVDEQPFSDLCTGVNLDAGLVPCRWDMMRAMVNHLC